MEKKESLNFIENDIVFIYGKFDDTISTHVIPGFFDLVKNESKKKDGKIVIDINSHGGYTRILYQLLAIIENAKSKGVIVETRALGVAMSCGSILAASGTKGNRFISENTTHLCHLGSSGFRVYTDTQLDRLYKNSKTHFNRIRNLYTKYAKIPDLENVIKDDALFIYDEQCVEWGLADKFYEQCWHTVKNNI